MRTGIAIMGIVAILGVGVRAQPASQLSEKPASSVVLKVSGMSCDLCASRVEKTAKKIAGVTSAMVSQPKGQAEIRFDPMKTSADAIAKIIEDKTGFKTEAPKKAAPVK